MTVRYNTRRDFLKSVGAGAAGLAVAPAILAAGKPLEKRPNVIVVMTDD